MLRRTLSWGCLPLLFAGGAAGGGNPPFDPTAVWSAFGGQAGANFGISAIAACDVNGDGYRDVVVGADHYDDGETDEGRVLLYYGTPTGPSLAPGWWADGNQAGAIFGHRVAAGDVDGDGYDDVIVGAPRYDGSATDGGAVFVFPGSATGPVAAEAWHVFGGQPGALYGNSVAAVDVDGDGFDDVVAGAPSFDGPLRDEGRVSIFRGSADGPERPAAWTLEVDAEGAYFGFPVASAGDVNGDGYEDVVVGAIFSDVPVQDAGAAYLYHGSPDGPRSSWDWSVRGEQFGEYLGSGLRGAGDVDGDGYDDVVIGAPNRTVDLVAVGRVRVWLGSIEGLSTEAAWTGTGEVVAGFFGFPAGGAGDLDGDGFDEIVVGCIYCADGEVDEGFVYVYRGGPAGPTEPPRVLQSNVAAAELGFSVAGGGDLTGDGVDDLVLGARAFTAAEALEGAVFVHAGTAAGAGTIGPSLRLDRDGRHARLDWGASCRPADVDYAVYGGALGGWNAPAPLTCSTAGASSWEDTEAADRFYLVAPRNAAHEGSLGATSAGAPRDAGPLSCAPRLPASCPAR